jgi:hypothetical protein
MTRLPFVLRSLARVGLLIGLVAAPVALVPAVNAASHVTIEAPAQAKKGLGLVLLVSLQRA